MHIHSNFHFLMGSYVEMHVRMLVTEMCNLNGEKVNKWTMLCVRVRGKNMYVMCVCNKFG